MSDGRCTDCGWAPVWWRHGGKCRSCVEKGGDEYLARVKVDVDKVLAHFGGDTKATEAFLDAMRSDW